MAVFLLNCYCVFLEVASELICTLCSEAYVVYSFLQKVDAAVFHVDNFFLNKAVGVRVQVGIQDELLDHLVLNLQVFRAPSVQVAVLLLQVLCEVDQFCHGIDFLNGLAVRAMDALANDV